jgi:hypothetical protein
MKALLLRFFLFVSLIVFSGCGTLQYRVGVLRDPHASEVTPPALAPLVAGWAAEEGLVDGAFLQVKGVDNQMVMFRCVDPKSNTLLAVDVHASPDHSQVSVGINAGFKSKEAFSDLDRLWNSLKTYLEARLGPGRVIDWNLVGPAPKT